MPHAIRYRPAAAPRCVAGILLPSNCSSTNQEIQNAPYDVNAVAPNVLLLRNSHMPASSWAIPPYASARPRTTGTPLSLTRPALKKLRTKVVSANAASPRGAGSPIDGATGGMTPLDCVVTPSSFVAWRTAALDSMKPSLPGVNYPGSSHYTRALGHPGNRRDRQGLRGYAGCPGLRGGVARGRPPGTRRFRRGEGGTEEDGGLPSRRRPRDSDR